MRLRLSIAALVAANLIAGVASAQEQPWLSDRRLTEGIGIRLGNFELHPGAAAELGYDSNYFLRANDGTPGEERISVWRLRVTPSISLSTLGATRRGAVAPGAPPTLDFRTGAWLAYNEFFAANDAPGSEDVPAQRHVDAGVNAKLTISPHRPIGGDLYGDYTVLGEPSSTTAPDVAFDRGTARGGAGVTWRPGGGMFEWRLGGEVAYNYFEDEPYTLYDNFAYSILTRGRWRWFPRTAWIYDARYTMIRYTHPNTTTQNDGDVVEARVGQAGLITNRFAFLAQAGWNSTYYVDRGQYRAQNYDGLVLHGELKWFLMPTPTGDSASVGLSSVAVGYTRNWANSYLGSFYVQDRGYVSFAYFMGGVFVLNLQAGVARSSYPLSTYQGGANPAFGVTELDARLYGEYRFSDTFALTTTWIYEKRAADRELDLPDDPMTGAARTENIDYSRWQAWVGARWFM